MAKDGFTKDRKGRNKGIEWKMDRVQFCEYGIKAITRGTITENQMEAIRKIMVKYLRKNGRVVRRVYANRSITRKPLEVRMGNGKGEISGYVFNVKPGVVIYEMDCDSLEVVFKVGMKCRKKLPVRTRVTFRDDIKNVQAIY